MNNDNAYAEGRWGELQSPHNTYLEIARFICSVTDPTVIRFWDESSDQPLPESYNDIGGRGVNHLTNKINQVIWPATLPFIKYEMNEAAVIRYMLEQEIPPQSQDQVMELWALIQSTLAKREQLVKKEFETSGIRPLAEEGTLHSIVTGTACIHIPKNKKEAPQFFNLNQLRLVRDYKQDVIEFLICQKLHRSSLPPQVREWANTNIESSPDSSSGIPVDQDKIYTWGKLQDDGSWEIHQEMNNKRVPGSESKIPAKKPLPYVFLPGMLRYGEHYGHPYLEASGGSKLLRHLEFYEKAYKKRTSMSAHAKIRQAPGALTRPRELLRDQHSDFYVGNEGDYEFMSLGGMNEFQITALTIEKLERSLGQIFLLFDAVRRDGERVTAYENSLAMGELQAGLGAFATAIQMGQQQIAALITERIKDDLRLVAPLPDGLDDADVVVVTGMNAMSRQFELNKEVQFVDLVKNLYGPEVASEWIKVGKHIKRMEMQSGVPGDSIVKSEQEHAEEIQAQQMAQLGQEAALAASQQSQQPPA